ncbi:14488_t:CDS:2 [Funneliformis geosporum]|uniref:14488_t:CDS:1 n=1 Tax=Funneliformis geosporum TaxID=1117311 RepID=A0A9W4SAV2_9GLOM|nr:14488_t:CDS:2 [Funneliformis geosporum]
MVVSLNFLILGQPSENIFNVVIGDYFTTNEGVKIFFNDLTVANFREILFLPTFTGKCLPPKQENGPPPYAVVSNIPVLAWDDFLTNAFYATTALDTGNRVFSRPNITGALSFEDSFVDMFLKTMEAKD